MKYILFLFLLLVASNSLSSQNREIGIDSLIQRVKELQGIDNYDKSYPQPFYTQTEKQVDKPEKNEKIFGLHPSVFTAFVTALIFFVGFYLNHLRENYKENKILKEKETYFYTEINALLVPLKKQKESFADFIKQLKENKEQNYFLGNESSLDFEILNNIQHTEAFKIFVTNKNEQLEDKLQYFNSIFTALKTCKDIKLDIKETFYDFMEKFKVHRDVWGQNMNNIVKIYNRMVTENNKIAKIGGTREQYFDDFAKIITDWRKIDNYPDLYIAYKEFIEPMQIFINNNSHDSRSQELIEYIDLCSYSHGSINQLREVYVKYFESAFNNYQNSDSNISKSIGYFRSLKSKTSRYFY